jgi:hypothetical protein
MRVPFVITIFMLALFGLLALNHSSFEPRTILVGGEYTVQTSEIRNGDMLILFARVKVVEGGQVTGKIRVLGGVLEVAGQVDGDIQAYGSQVDVETPSAQINGTINTIYSLPELPALPSILLVVS